MIFDNESEAFNNESYSFPNCIDALDYAAIILNDKTTERGVQIFFGCIYSLIFFLGISGNGLVIVSVYKDKLLHTVRNMFIVSLSCSDIAVCLTSVLITPITTIAKNWLFGRAMCYIVPLFQGMSICISTYTLTAIAFDRFILIIHPTKPPISQLKAMFMILGIWILAAAFSSPVAVQSNFFTLDNENTAQNESMPQNQEPYPCGEFCGEKWEPEEGKKLYGTVVLVVQFIIPLCIIAFCYTTICVRLSNGYTRKLLQCQQSCMTERQQAVLKRKQRTNIMLISMVVIFASCWFLQVLINLLNDYGLTPEFIARQSNLYGLSFHVIAMTSTFWNPILYAGLNEGFRMAFIELLPCLRRIYGLQEHEKTVRQHRILSNGHEILACKGASHVPSLINGKSCIHDSNLKNGPISHV